MVSALLCILINFIFLDFIVFIPNDITLIILVSIFSFWGIYTK